jgi:replication factor A1
MVMRIKDIKANQGKIDVEGIIVGVADTRTVNLKTGGTSDVADAVLADDSGQIKLPLWNADISKVRVGNRVKITNGYATQYKGELQLSAGKFGKLEVVS